MSSSQFSVGLVERAYAFVSLLFLIGAFNPGDFSLTEATWTRYRDFTGGSFILQTIGSIIYLISFVILLTQRKKAILTLSRNKSLVIFVLLAVASTYWSILPDVTLRRSLALVGTTIFGCYLAVRFRPTDLLTLLAWAFALVVFENLFVVFLVPEVGVHSIVHVGAWKGVLGHKNNFGREMLLGAIVFWMVSQQAKEAKAWAWTGAIICLAMVAFSQSRTAWVAASFLILSIPSLWYLRKPGSPIGLQIRLFLFGLGAGCVAILLIENVDAILDLLSRDETLTGRTRIWTRAFEVGVDRFWIGHGYRSFWLGQIFKYGHGHNSLLDLWLELGLAGFALFIYILAVFTGRALKRLLNMHDEVGLWYILFIIFIISFSITSQIIPDHGTITWALFVASLLYLSPEPRRAFHPSVSRAVP